MLQRYEVCEVPRIAELWCGVCSAFLVAWACTDDASTPNSPQDAAAGFGGTGGASSKGAGGTSANSGTGGATQVDASTGGGSGGSGGSNGGSSGGGGSSAGSGGSTSGTPVGFVFSPYKDTSINMNWNTNVISSNVSGAPLPLASDLAANQGTAVTLAFATGECGSEIWGGVAGATLASANVSLLVQAGIKYVVSTGGAAGAFTCATDAGFETFLGRWASPNLIGVDFDIEAGQSASAITDLVRRIHAAHYAHPALRFSLTLATLASNDGSATAHSMGANAEDNFNTYGDQTMAAVQSTLGFAGESSWPEYLTVNLMTMDYGAPSPRVCVVSNGVCQMGESALQAAYNLHDKWGVPYASIELTPMIGRNDVSDELFVLSDVDTVATFALSQGLAGVHYWSYDRDTDCVMSSASPTCNSMGSTYAGPHGYLERFLTSGLP
jgi:hypothetical protein